MNIDALVNSIEDDELRENLSQWIYEWKQDESDINKLYELVAKWHGSVWFKDSSKQNEFWSNLQEFKEIAIKGIGGMTVNERLYWFGLFEEWDNSDEAGQQRIRDKLHALA